MAYVPHFPPRIHLLSTEMSEENPFSMENHDNLKKTIRLVTFDYPQ